MSASKYKPEYCKQLIEHMSKGLSYDTFAAEVEVSRQALYRWENVHDEWREAKDIAFSKAQIWWERVGIEGLWNENFGQGQGSKTLNAAIWIFNMRNRFGWRNDPIEVTKEQSAPVHLVLNREQRSELIEFARSKKKK